MSKSFFSLLDKLISSFIWNRKNARIRKSILQRHREHGGLSLPNIQYYYWAANIRAMLYWVNSLNNSGPHWLSLENMSCRPASLHALLCSKFPSPEPIFKFSSNPVVKHSFKIWAQFRRSFALKELSVYAPIARNHMFTPSIMDETFNTWSVKGLRTLKDIFIDGDFASFSQVKMKFQIPDSQFFRYLQLRSFASSSLSHYPSLPPSSLLESIIDLSPYSKGTIGRIYSVINSYNLEPLDQLKRKWEVELDIEFSEELWQCILNNIYASSICLKHRVIQFKIVHRLHWSKVKLAKFKPNLDPNCDRCEMEPGTLSHMFWLCPRLRDFWQLVFKFLSDTLKTYIEPEAIISIFGITPQSLCLNQSNKNLIAFTTLLARRLILLKWKEKSPPTFKQWLKDLLYYMALEKIRHTIRGCTDMFYITWQPVLDQIKKMDPSVISEE